MKTFREALLTTLTERKVSLKSVAEGSGVSYEQLKKLKQKDGRSTNVEDARKIAAFFGSSLDEFIDGEIGSVAPQIAALLSQLDPETRRSIEAGVIAQVESLLSRRQESPEDNE